MGDSSRRGPFVHRSPVTRHPSPVRRGQSRTETLHEPYKREAGDDSSDSLGVKKPTEVGWLQMKRASSPCSSRAHNPSPRARASATSSADDLILCDLFDFGTDLHFAACLGTVVDVCLEPDVDVNTTDFPCEFECATRAVRLSIIDGVL